MPHLKILMSFWRILYLPMFMYISIFRGLVLELNAAAFPKNILRWRQIDKIVKLCIFNNWNKVIKRAAAMLTHSVLRLDRLRAYYVSRGAHYIK